MISLGFKYGTHAVIVHGIEVTDNLYMQRIFEKYAGKKVDFGKGYYAYKNKAHIPGCKDHIHFYYKKNQLYSLNFDGTAHDQSHGSTLHNQVIKGILKFFPGCSIPPGGKIAEAIILKDPLVISLIKDIRDGKPCDELLVINLDEIECNEKSDDPIKLLRDLLVYLNEKHS